MYILEGSGVKQAMQERMHKEEILLFPYLTANWQQYDFASRGVQG